MKRTMNKTMTKAYKEAGYRERYAMDNGNKSIIYVNGNKCYKFTYSKYNEYQDANGAIYDTIRECWIS